MPYVRYVSAIVVCTAMLRSIFRRGLLRCSFNIYGQCKGLESWDE